MKLSNGSEWNLTAINGTGKWLDKLAYIMRLEPAENDHLPEIIFCYKGDFSRISKHNESSYCDNRLRSNTKDWLPYANKYVCTWFNDTTPDIICEIDNSGENESKIINMWFSLIALYQRIQDSGSLPLHAALLELNGRGVILAASGGTGKSTSCRRVPDYWRPLCDDMMLVVFDKEYRYLAHPFPTWTEYLWGSSDKTWDVQYSVPICAIFFLKQAKEDEVIPLGEGQAAININQSATQITRLFLRELYTDTKRTLSIQQFQNACNIAKAVPSFTLCASLHGRFWEEMEKALANI